MIKIAIASDHGGYVLKEQVKEKLLAEGYEIGDFGTDSLESCHYPVYALKAAEAVRDGKYARGILICTSGEGVMIAANKVHAIRCGLVYNDEVARLCGEHNNCNMIAVGAKYFALEPTLKMIKAFLTSTFAGGRHALRVDMISRYEDEHH